MKKFFVFLKKTWWLFALLCIAPLFVIVGFYVLEFYYHRIDLSAGEWSQLLGSAFGYWGTVLLGVLAFWQNEQAQENNDILTQYERKRMAPVFSVVISNYSRVFEMLEIEITNCSDNLACEFVAAPLLIYKSDRSGVPIQLGEYHISGDKPKDYLESLASVRMIYSTPNIVFSADEEITFVLSFYAKDIIGLVKKTTVTINANQNMNLSYSYSVVDV